MERCCCFDELLLSQGKCFRGCDDAAVADVAADDVAADDVAADDKPLGPRCPV